MPCDGHKRPLPTSAQKDVVIRVNSHSYLIFLHLLQPADTLSYLIFLHLLQPADTLSVEKNPVAEKQLGLTCISISTSH